jgi:hypothetical protein
VSSRRLPPADYYSLGRVARALDRHSSTVHRWRMKGLQKNGKLKCFRIGGQWYVEHDELERFLFGANEPGAGDRSEETRSHDNNRLRDIDEKLDNAGF